MDTQSPSYYKGSHKGRMRRQGRNYRFKGTRQRIENYLDRQQGPEPVAVDSEDLLRVNTLPELSVEYFPALFIKYPLLIGKIPWADLRGCLEPSPPFRLIKSSHWFGDNYMFMKRESLDFHIISENKARKLEFILGKTLEEHTKKIVAFGPIGSSHCLSIAKAGAEIDLKTEIYLSLGSFSSEDVDKVLAMKNLGARVHFRSHEWSLRWSLFWKKWWGKIFPTEIVPFGGATGLGALGYVSAMVELASQIQSGKVPNFDFLFVPVVTGTSLVGMEVGRRLMGMNSLKIVGFPVAQEVPKTNLVKMANEAFTTLQGVGDSKMEKDFKEQDFVLWKDQSKACSDQKNFNLERWMIQFMETEGVELDPLYTGKALRAASSYLLRSKMEGKNILFWNTYSPFRRGDLPSHRNIPYRLRRWMRDTQYFR